MSTATGKWTLAPGADAPGRDLTPDMTRFVNRMACACPAVSGRGKLAVTTGTSHSGHSSSGNVCDHYPGNGVDLGMVVNGGTNDGPVGDRIAACAFMAAGLPGGEAVTRGRQGGAQTLTRNGIRVQIIWKSDVGGNHHDHVHAGIDPQ